MAATVSTYTQGSPERSKPKPFYRTTSSTFEKLRGGKVSPVLNGASSLIQNYPGIYFSVFMFQLVVIWFAIYMFCVLYIYIYLKLNVLFLLFEKCKKIT